MRKVRIKAGRLEARGGLNETRTAGQIFAVLPLKSRVNVWGEEIYFSVPVKAGLENAREAVDLGDIAYWPEGSALCIFLGRTPVSTETEIRPISPVNVIGKLEGDAKSFKDLLGEFRQGAEIEIVEES